MLFISMHELLNLHDKKNVLMEGQRPWIIRLGRNSQCINEMIETQL